MREVLQTIGLVIGVIWLVAFLAVLLMWLYAAVMGWLIRRAWEPVERLVEEIAEEQQAERDYLMWLEGSWRAEAGPGDERPGK